MRRLLRSSAMPESRRSPKVAASKSGCMGAGRVLSSCGRPSMSGLGMSTKKSTWARSFYDQQRNRNKSHHAAVRALSFKWIRIVFRCWKDRVTYDDTRYTLSVQERSTSKNVEIRVKNFYGFAQFDGLSC